MNVYERRRKTKKNRLKHSSTGTLEVEAVESMERPECGDEERAVIDQVESKICEPGCG